MVNKIRYRFFGQQNNEFSYYFLHFNEDQYHIRDTLLNYFTSLHLWDENSEPPFIEVEDELEITKEEWKHLNENLGLFNIELVPFVEEVKWLGTDMTHPAS